MGIMSSTTRNNQVPPEKPGDSFPPENWPDEAKAALGLLMKDLYALFAPKLGDSSKADLGDTDSEREKQAEERFCEFMKGGGCKEAFTALEDCVAESGDDRKCKEIWSKLMKCMYSHPDYYHPLLAVLESGQEQLAKELTAKLVNQGIHITAEQAEGFKKRF